MYVPRVEVKKSNINGVGVFALKQIAKDSLVWKYEAGYDLAYTPDEFDKMLADQKSELLHSAYLSPWSGLWICPPPDDPACYTNHSNSNNTSVKYAIGISSEPYFIANRTINAGEEITNDYREFDQITRQVNPDWANNDLG